VTRAGLYGLGGGIVTFAAIGGVMVWAIATAPVAVPNTAYAGPTPSLAATTTRGVDARSPHPLVPARIVYPRQGEGWASLIARSCVAGTRWQDQSLGRRLIYGVAVTLTCAAPATTPKPSASSGYVLPVAGMHCRPATGGGVYGAPRPLGAAHPTRYHEGVDLGASTAGVHAGDPIRAVAAGTVTRAGFISANAGNGVWIAHAGGVQTRYYHASRVVVKVGQHVNAGQTIAYVGATGDAVGAHLHYEVLINGSHVNPGPFMAARGAKVVC
jgi:murein DD-endopeptidase MepM/ murein hydrolase activator NlpD